MTIENILKKKLVTNKDLYDCCLVLLQEYLSSDNEILFYSIKYIKYDKFFCNKVNKILKKKLDDNTLFITVEYYIYAYIYRKLLQFIYLYEQDMYEQNIHEDFWNKFVNDTKNAFNKVGNDTKNAFNKVGNDAKNTFNKVGNDVKNTFNKVGDGLKTAGNKIVAVAKNTVTGIKDTMVGYVNKLDNSRKCLQSGNLECAFNNIKDIATDAIPAINVIDKLAKGQKVTAEDMIMLAISVAPMPGGAVVGAAVGTVGKMVVKSVGKSVAKAVVQEIIHNPKVNSKVSDIINKTMATNKNIKPEELQKIVANHINQMTLVEMKKEEKERAEKERAEKERAERERAARERAERERAARKRAARRR